MKFGFGQYPQSLARRAPGDLFWIANPRSLARGRL